MNQNPLASRLGTVRIGGLRNTVEGLSGPIQSLSISLAIPRAVIVVALLTTLLHMAPVWRADSQTPPGWIFTGNYSVSPDHMQYRVWMRVSHETGVLVPNTHTTEQNKPHLPVVLYYVLGQISSWTGTGGMFVYHYIGAFFALGLTMLLFVTVRHFLGGGLYQTWWVFLAVLLGGGLGAHLKILSGLPFLSRTEVIQRLIAEPLKAQPVFEDHRGIYAFVTLFDTHYSLIWLLLIISVLSIYFVLRRFSWQRLALVALLHATATLVHLYEGPTLVAITLFVVLLCRRKNLAVRPALAILAASLLAVSASMTVQLLLYSSSGLPLPPWRAPTVMFSTFVIGYPLALGIIAWGVGDYWRKAALKECVLLGWALGCTVLVLAGPFYPYPDRGAMTLQVPLFIIAGTIFFSHWTRVRPLIAVAAVVLLGAMPIWLTVKTWQATAFDPGAPYAFVSPERQEVIQELKTRAASTDIILAGKSSTDWRRDDDLWLAPEYPGKWYASHYFLTVNYDRKRAEILSFFRSSAPEQAAFLKKEGIRFLYVPEEEHPARFQAVPELVALKAGPTGWLFEYLARSE